MTRRIEPHPVRGPCCCIGCREYEQLAEAAVWDFDWKVRVVAQVMLSAMTDVQNGRYGGVTLANCFD